MNFINNTRYPAEFLAGSTGDREMVGIIACNVTTAFNTGHLIAVDIDQAWPVFNRQYLFSDVILQTDLEPRKTGIDLIIFGNAIAKDGRAVRCQPIRIRCGKVEHKIIVFGDRVWRKSKYGLIPSEPEPFIEMPLTNNLAYGGKPVLDGMEMPHSINPDGRGFYLLEEQAENNPLPNLELPNALIKTWQDQPMPACLYKPVGWLEDIAALGSTPEELAFRFMEGGFNQTVPQLVIQPDELGDSIYLQGFSHEGDMVIPMPPINGPTAHVDVGSLRSIFPSIISTVVVLTQEKILIVTYLCLFRYLFRPMEQRQVVLKWDPVKSQRVNDMLEQTYA